MPLSSRSAVVVALGITQTLAWASSYYLPAMLAAPMAKDLGIETPTVFAAFSFALVISAFLGPYAGRCIDRWGGRPVLMATNLVFAAGMLLLGMAHSVVGLLVAWAVLGVGMGSGLYEAAFAGLVRLYGRDSRRAITGITLFAGFASTVGWPLSTLLEAQYGWRGACFGWAALHVFLGLPLNALLPKAAAVANNPEPAVEVASSASTASSSLKASVLLSVVFAITWFISTAMAAHLPRLLMAGGATLAAAVAFGALVGPAQVGARILDFGLLRKVHPLLSARLATRMHPIGAALMALAGAPFAAVFVIPRRRKRHPDDRQGHAPAGSVRAAGLWRATGLAHGPSADSAGASAMALWGLPGPMGSRSAVAFSDAWAGGVRRPNGIAL